MRPTIRGETKFFRFGSRTTCQLLAPTESAHFKGQSIHIIQLVTTNINTGSMDLVGTLSTNVTEEAGRQLLCYSDHSPNNTCITDVGGFCYAQLSLKINGDVKRELSCLLASRARDLPIINRLICDSDIGPTSTRITRCCNTSNFCNNQSNFLNDLEEKRSSLAGPLNNELPYNNTKTTGVNWQGFSNLLPEWSYPIALVVISVIIIVLCRRYYRNPRRAESTTTEAGLYTTTSTSDDHSSSENWSGKNTVDAAISDTSMASREPLINKARKPTETSIPVKLTPQITSLEHPEKLQGPYMTLHPPNSKQPSTFQMTIGSGEPLQPKRGTSSGSGAGQPYLMQRSIADDIELHEVIGRGYFGVVHRGEFKGEPVAVKIFQAAGKPGWEREADIYQTTMLRHKNILGFWATDTKEEASVTTYWLVTDYYHMGSLYDFLKRADIYLLMPDAVKMAFSIANGLSHLHREIFGTQGKPAIAHRDIKSKNILVKNDGTCCIADLGMAVRFNSRSNIVDSPTKIRVGTRRYLAPEVLDNSLNLGDIEAVKATDIYSLSLVLWEIMRRTSYTARRDFGSDSGASNGIHRPDVLPEQQFVSAPPRNESPSNLSEPTVTKSPPQLPLPVAQTPMRPPVAYSSEPDMLSQRPTLISPALALVPPPPELNTDSDIPIERHRHQITASEFFSSDSEQSEKIEKRPIHPKYSYEPSLGHLQESPESSIDDLDHELATTTDPYEAPYQDFVSLDPTIEEMREVVCAKKIRPPILLRWTKFAAMRDFASLMSECWYEKPQSRLPALRLRKSLGDIGRSYFNLNLEYD